MMVPSAPWALALRFSGRVSALDGTQGAHLEPGRGEIV